MAVLPEAKVALNPTYPLVISHMARWTMDHRNQWSSDLETPIDRGFSSQPCFITWWQWESHISVNDLRSFSVGRLGTYIRKSFVMGLLVAARCYLLKVEDCVEPSICRQCWPNSHRMMPMDIQPLQSHPLTWSTEQWGWVNWLCNQINQLVQEYRVHRVPTQSISSDAVKHSKHGYVGYQARHRNEPWNVGTLRLVGWLAPDAPGTLAVPELMRQCLDDRKAFVSF